MKQNARCPHCRTVDALVDNYRFVITLQQWPLLLLFLGVLCSFGELIGLKHGVSVIFALFSLPPFLFGVQKKAHCCRCDIDFAVAPEKE